MKLINYNRVIPRDLFNEAKLLKCLGRLALLANDELAYGIRAELIDASENGFKIFLTLDGCLTCTNVVFEYKGKSLFLKSTYNSKSNYPLVCEHDYCEYLVFDRNGNLDTDFIYFLTTNF